MAHYSRFGAYAGVIAAASMTFAPAQAAEVNPAATTGHGTSIHADFAGGGAFDTSTYEEQADTAEWRGRRWSGRRGWRRNRIDGGDVLAGVLVLGGIAAIASAASNNNRRRDRDVVVVERERDNVRYDDRRSNPRASNGSGLDNAVSQCLNEIERDVRVESVDGASRLPQGWVVTGVLFNGSGFSCEIGNDGRISDIDYGGFSGGPLGANSDDGQFSDSRYADARASINGQSFASAAPQGQGQGQGLNQSQGELLPAYPGGPLPGEEFPD